MEKLPAEESPAGDFIAGAKADKSFPDAKTWSELKSYLHWRGATDDQVIAGRLVWRRYLNDKKNLGSAEAPMFVEENDR